MLRCYATPLPYLADLGRYTHNLRDEPGVVLFDSGRPAASRGQYDVLSAWPLAQLALAPGESAKQFFQRSRELLAQLPAAQPPEGYDAPFCGGLIGYLSYDFGRAIEPLPSQAAADIALNPAQWGLYDWALINDHQARQCYLLSHPSMSAERHAQILARLQQAGAPAAFSLQRPFAAEQSAARYAWAFARIHQYIHAGDCYQVNYAQRFSAPFQGHPWAAYQKLRSACPTPFAAYMRINAEQQIASLSPERFLSIRQGRIETRPIKGTRPRDAHAARDAALADELQHSEKDRAENLMIVDLLRNDLGRCCTTGSVQVPELFSLESYPNVHHLVSAVIGQLAPGVDAFEVLLACFPGGSITGAPKIRAMQIIDELEPTRRALYCGSLLYLDCRGELDSSITIRTLLFDKNQVYCWGGGGIVADSNETAEYQESLAKVAVLLRTLES